MFSFTTCVNNKKIVGAQQFYVPQDASFLFDLHLDDSTNFRLKFTLGTDTDNKAFHFKMLPIEDGNTVHYELKNPAYFMAGMPVLKLCRYNEKLYSFQLICVHLTPDSPLLQCSITFFEEKYNGQ